MQESYVEDNWAVLVVILPKEFVFIGFLNNCVLRCQIFAELGGSIVAGLCASDFCGGSPPAPHIHLHLGCRSCLLQLPYCSSWLVASKWSQNTCLFPFFWSHSGSVRLESGRFCWRFGMEPGAQLEEVGDSSSQWGRCSFKRRHVTYSSSSSSCRWVKSDGWVAFLVYWNLREVSRNGVWLWAALKPDHHGRHEHLLKAHGTNFAESRVKYRFLHQSITGLNLDSYIVSLIQEVSLLLLRLTGYIIIFSLSNELKEIDEALWTNVQYSFFRQFGKPIYRTDYFCLRVGFITVSHALSSNTWLQDCVLGRLGACEEYACFWRTLLLL